MKINIIGEITDYKSCGCFCPQDLKDVLSTLGDNEPLEVEITSEGGSVFAGIQISNLLARWKGNVTTHGVGLVASIATVILMAGKKVAIDENCFAMIHLPWTFTQGNANDLEKEIGTLNKCKEAMMGFYRKHSKVSDEDIEKMLSEETWFLGSEFADVFDVEVVPNDQNLNIAAKFDLTKFHKVPEVLNMKNMKEQAVTDNDDEKKVEEIPAEPVIEEPVEEEKKEEVVEKEETTEEEEKVEEPVEEVKEEEEKKEDDEVLNKEDVEKKFEEYENTIATLNSRIAELEEQLKEKEEETSPKETSGDEETVSKAECEKRVSGMQASMQKQVNKYVDELNDFKTQLKAKDEELVSVKAEIISLNQTLEKSTKELSEMTSALEEKTNALAVLNANVNTPKENFNWKSLKGKQFFDYVKAHPELVK